MQKITPHLWFDKQAQEAAEFYVGVFGKDSTVHSVTPIEGAPGGDASMVTFTLRGYEFMSISAGPIFTINPSVSFFLNFDPASNPQAREELDAFWAKLSEGGKALMDIGEYPFSKRYGWIQDKYGVTWQLILTNPQGEPRPFIVPSLLFTGPVAGKAEEAMKYYVETFKNAKVGMVARYPAGMTPDKEGTVMFEDYQLESQWFASMDSAHPHAFNFNEAVSLVVSCETQEEIDSLWARLSARPESEQCGWCKDQFGVSWQIVPSAMWRLMGGPKEQRLRVISAFMKMKKFDIAELEKAARGE